ncbi:MAG: FG-GAP repeat protein, partial [Verrucomicrobiota bacterium]
MKIPPLFRILAGALLVTPAFASPVQQAYIKASNTDSSDEFGISVAISGDTMVIGAIFEDSSATGVDGDQSDNSASASGAAYVFVRSGTTWIQQAYLKASNSAASDQFGCKVAVSGDTVVVGAYGEASNATGMDGDQNDDSAVSSGAAYVFVRDGTTWIQQAYLKASNTGGPSPGEPSGDFFGLSVAVSGDTVVVGAFGEDSNATGVNGDQSDNSAGGSGAAYVFVRSGTTWSQQAYLKASNTATNAGGFGWSVAVSGDTVVVGAAFEDSSTTGVNGDQSSHSAEGSGAAYVFVRSGTTWSQQAYLKASNTDAGDLFGTSVSVSGDTIVVGGGREGVGAEDSNANGVNGNQSSNSATNSGAAYVFVRSGTNWSQQAYLKASNTGADDFFGLSVAVSGDTVVVGAYGEDSSARGVNANQNNNSAGESGAAYVFVRSGTTWRQQAYLKASNTGGAFPGNVGDFFGHSVSVSGDTVVAGAVLEFSNATGVNGNQSDNSAAYSGAAYVFTGLGVGPSLALAPDDNAGYFLRFTGAPDVTYRLQRASSVNGPWATVVTNTAPASGLIEYHETSPA